MVQSGQWVLGSLLRLATLRLRKPPKTHRRLHLSVMLSKTKLINILNMNDFNRLQILISQLTAIRKQHEKASELTGEKFNVFNILGLSTNEVRTHSAFIGEILNPKGTHYQKEIYLKEFVKCFNLENFDYSSATLEIEKSIGYISNNKTDGGNIDILITDKNNNAIIIENKIYAVDQENQLLRYFNYGQKYCTTYLFYLTLDGKKPTKFSTNELDENKYNCISYSSNIKSWLEKCREKSVNQPIIRETLTQYINLINQLTGQSINKIMNTEIVNKIVSDDDNLKTFFELHKSNLMIDIKKELTIRFKQQLNDIANKMELTLHFSDDLGFNTETGWEFHFKNSKNGYYLSFGFCSYFSRLVYGIFNKTQPYNTEHKTLISNRLGKGLGWGNWLWIKEFENNLKEWNNNVEPWIAITDNSLKSNIKDKVNLLIQNLKDIDN